MQKLKKCISTGREVDIQFFNFCIVYLSLDQWIYSLFTSLPVDIQYIHFLRAKAHLEGYMPIYTMANDQSDH